MNDNGGTSIHHPAFPKFPVLCHGITGPPFEDDYPPKGKGKDGKGKKGKNKSKGKCLVADMTLVDAGGIDEFP